MFLFYFFFSSTVAFSLQPSIVRLPAYAAENVKANKGKTRYSGGYHQISLKCPSLALYVKENADAVFLPNPDRNNASHAPQKNQYMHNDK